MAGLGSEDIDMNYVPALRIPGPQSVARHLQQMQKRSFNYAGRGATRGIPPHGYKHRRATRLLGYGPAVFDRACEAIRQWEMFPPGWTKAHPAPGGIVEGQTVVMLFKMWKLWFFGQCRVVYVVDEQSPTKRFGFAYGTLPGHPLRGEERFLIEWNPADDSVWYELTAFAKPINPLAAIGLPMLRRAQTRFWSDSMDTMEALASTVTATRPPLESRQDG